MRARRSFQALRNDQWDSGSRAHQSVQLVPAAPAEATDIGAVIADRAGAATWEEPDDAPYMRRLVLLLLCCGVAAIAALIAGGAWVIHKYARP